MFNNMIYHPGDTIQSMEIDNQPTLACVTTNVNRYCCSENQTLRIHYTGAVGEWYYPDSSIVPHSNSSAPFNRIGGACLVHLARLNNALSTPLGVYTCEVPNESNGAIVSASITISDGSIAGQ